LGEVKEEGEYGSSHGDLCGQTGVAGDVDGRCAGVLVSVFQAVTSIQDMTLTFIPKILAVILALILFFPWMLNVLVDFTTDLFSNIPYWVR
jgi:flagellar biosynthesis protein FliQ